MKLETTKDAMKVEKWYCCGYEDMDLQRHSLRNVWCCEDCEEAIEEDIITTSKLKRIQENIQIPTAGENIGDYKVVDVWEDGHFLIPEICLIIVKKHYEGFIKFLNSLPEFQQFADCDTSPYKRTDDVVGPGYTTQIFYTDPETQVTVLVGFDDYPVICLDSNKDCYLDNCEQWSVEDVIYEQ